MGKEDRRDIQIVGSVPLANADEVIRTVATILGERVSRITDHHGRRNRPAVELDRMAGPGLRQPPHVRWL